MTDTRPTRLPGTWAPPSGRRGNFDYRSIVSSFEVDVRDAYVDRTYFGLPLLGAYWWSNLGDADGNTLAPMRKSTSEMSSGLQLQTNLNGDALEIDHAAFLRSQRGVGVRWGWADEGTLTVTADGSPLNEPVDFRFDGRTLHWSEGELMDISGTFLGAYQWYTPGLDDGGGNYYASMVYEGTGQVLGREVRGIVAFDQLYGPQGQVFQTSPMFNAIELGWVTFANGYADGEYEVGACCLGAAHWGFAAIADQDGDLEHVTDIEATIELDDEAYIQVATYHLPSGDWRFDARPRSRMLSLAAARNDQYHGQGGVVRRVGDEREPTWSRAWIESFPLNGTDRTGRW